MEESGAHWGRYLLAVGVGALLGGVAVALATRAMPRLMAGMMRRMMESMREEGVAPGEI